jgi:hypothetical protein
MPFLNFVWMNTMITPRANQMDFAGRVVGKDGIRRDGLHQILGCSAKK